MLSHLSRSPSWKPVFEANCIISRTWNTRAIKPRYTLIFLSPHTPLNQSRTANEGWFWGLGAGAEVGGLGLMKRRGHCLPVLTRQSSPGRTNNWLGRSRDKRWTGSLAGFSKPSFFDKQLNSTIWRQDGLVPRSLLLLAFLDSAKP